MTPQRCPGQDTRYWKGDSSYDIQCPHCGKMMEFFKDEPVRRCRACRKEVRNPRLDMGCAEWCQYAPICLGTMPDIPDAVGSLCERLVARMEAYFGDDQPLIDHALAVLRHAEQIMLASPDASGLIVRAAAILHDIGIPEARRKHGSAAGKFQEIEGPPIARKILEELGIDESVIEHVCRIIANHHSAGDIDTLEFRIIWDADWLVNLPGTQANKPEEELRRFIEETFRTPSGRDIAIKTFCP